MSAQESDKRDKRTTFSGVRTCLAFCEGCKHLSQEIAISICIKHPSAYSKTQEKAPVFKDKVGVRCRHIESSDEIGTQHPTQPTALLQTKL